MEWDFDEFDDNDENERRTPRERLIGFLAGVLLGAITLVLIAALILTMVGDIFAPDNRPNRPVQPIREVYTPSQADLINANYRPSGWAQPETQPLITPTPVAPEIVLAADAENLMLMNIYERVNPSVVNIEVVSGVHSESDIIDGSGSGFVFDLNGHIVTNSHVVRDADQILVTFYDGTMVNAEVIGIDDYGDLAVIRVDAAHVPLIPVQLGDSNALRVGQRVIVIGNPFGLAGSMTVGIVSALGRTLPSAQLLDQTYQSYSNPSIIQVDAAVNPGNSGGPLLDSYGLVVGVNTAIRTETGTFEGIAFAVPVNTLNRIVPQLITDGHARYSWLGISSPNLDRTLSVAALADQLGLAARNGVLISSVEPDSPAARAGLRAGTRTANVRGVEIPTNSDIIVAINGQTLRDIDDLIAYLVENTSPGDNIVLTIVREAQTLDLNVTLGERPDRANGEEVAFPP
jgi:2-alkenal reductase